jgi:ABC-2 type transport system permease protein
VLVFSDQLILSVIVSLLFIYLIGFQLLPIYNEFDYMLMTQLYPVNKSQKTDAVQKLILIILLVVAAIFSIVLVIRLENKLQALMISVALFAESTAFVYLYANNRLKKLEKSLI